MPIMSKSNTALNKEAADWEYINYETSPKSPDLPSQILVVKEFWRCDPVMLAQCKSHCISPFLLPCVLSHLFQHSDNHMMNHIRPDWKGILQTNYKLTFWLNWVLKQLTPSLPVLATPQTQEQTVKANRVGQHMLKLPWAYDPKMLFCTLDLNHVHKQVLKTHIQRTQQTHCFFGFGE